MVEAVARGRRGVGCDINELAVFVAGVKTTRLAPVECCLIYDWVNAILPRLRYREPIPSALPLGQEREIRNLNLPRARPIKKALAIALGYIGELPTARMKKFARCILLNVGQWALNGKRVPPTLNDFRFKLVITAEQMLNGAMEFYETQAESHVVTLINGKCSDLPRYDPFSAGTKADLVITSPPYPGVHVLYHRWQVDGRKETAAPYWIANCRDGQGSAYYNFADRKAESDDAYFAELNQSFSSLRSVVKDGAFVVQLVAFSRPFSQLRRYVSAMVSSGFVDIGLPDRGRCNERVWRQVPQRTWHANLQGETNSSRELLLIHRAG
jgi:hypothetical protein